MLRAFLSRVCGSRCQADCHTFQSVFRVNLIIGTLVRTSTTLLVEIARVLAEVEFVRSRAIRRSHALTQPTLTGQPPILQNEGTERVETLGERMNYDRRISPSKNQACSSCHMPYAAFSGPIPSVNLTMIAYPGTAHFRAGKRSAQRYTYSPFFPVLQYNQEQGL